MGHKTMRLFFVIAFLVDLCFVCNAQRGNNCKCSFNDETPKRFRQSPIDLKFNETEHVQIPPINFGLYDETLKHPLQLKNNGKFVKIIVPETISGRRPNIAGSLLDSVYVAESLHIHWGSPQQKGSEHEVNGRRYDLEMHIVHRNIRYKDSDVASNCMDGLVVLGVFFQVGSSNVNYPGLNAIYNALDRVDEYGATTNLEIKTLDSLLGNINTGKFFTYNGSLTTPDYKESVTWHVFPDVIPISPHHLAKFWNIKNSSGQPLLNNFRPVQPINGRTIYYRAPYKNTDAKETNYL